MLDAAEADEGHAKLRAEIRARYRAVAAQPAGQFPYPIGRESAKALGYEPEWLELAPPAVVDRFVGVGNPFRLRRPAPGQRVLDIGCGCGLDTWVAATLVGAGGRVVGIDLTPEMLAWPRQHLVGRENIELREASAEALPFGDGSFDLVISNGVLNLVPDKDAAFQEIARVLTPGGALAAVDLLVEESVPAEVLEGVDAWSS